MITTSPLPTRCDSTPRDLVGPTVFHMLSAGDDNAGIPVHFGPSERCDLTLAPRAEISKSRKVLQVFRQRGDHRLKLRLFEESLPDVALRQPTNIRSSEDFLRLIPILNACPNNCVSRLIVAADLPSSKRRLM